MCHRHRIQEAERHPYPIARHPGVAGLWLAAGAGGAALAVTSTGDVVLLAVLLAVAAVGRAPLAAATAVVAAGATAIRWGTTSLTAIAGAQSVLGPAVSVRPLLSAASVGLAAASLLLVAPRGAAAVPWAVAAATLACGPWPSRPGDALARLAGLVSAAALAVVVQRVPDRVRTVLGAAAGVVAVGTATAGAL